MKQREGPWVPQLRKESSVIWGSEEMQDAAKALKTGSSGLGQLERHTDREAREGVSCFGTKQQSVICRCVNAGWAANPSSSRQEWSAPGEEGNVDDMTSLRKRGNAGSRKADSLLLSISMDSRLGQACNRRKNPSV